MTRLSLSLFFVIVYNCIMTKYRIVDLFAGIGGLRLGALKAIENRGDTTEIVFTSEIKPAAINVLKTNYPHDHISGDITKISATEIPAHDVLLAGFPCQAFSYAGSRLGFKDKTKGTLFFDVLRVLEHHRPSYFILENVEGILTHDKDPNIKPAPKYGRTIETIIESLKKLGYKVDFALLNAAGFGVPQMRKRVFIIGSRYNEVSFPSEHEHAGLKTILEERAVETDPKVLAFSELLLQSYAPEFLVGKVVRDKRNGADNLHSWNFHYKGETTAEEKKLMEALAIQSRRGSWAVRKGIKPVEGVPLNLADISEFYTPGPAEPTFEMLERLTQLGYLVKPSATTYRIKSGRLSFPITHILDPEKPAPTIVATDANRLSVLTETGLRRFTQVELRRLFGFPDDFVIPANLRESQVFDLFGNSVVVPVADKVTDALIYGRKNDA